MTERPPLTRGQKIGFGITLALFMIPAAALIVGLITWGAVVVWRAVLGL